MPEAPLNLTSIPSRTVSGGIPRTCAAGWRLVLWPRWRRRHVCPLSPSERPYCHSTHSCKWDTLCCSTPYIIARTFH